MYKHYNTLGLPENSNLDSVKKAYKKLAMKWHPDKNSSPDAPDEFKKITEAYSQIINPGTNMEDINLNDILGDIFSELTTFNGGFDSIFNNMFKKELPKGKNILKQISLTLEDIYNGNMYIISYDTQFINTKCKNCLKCSGQGKISQTQQIGPMVIQNLMLCENCEGTGFLNLYLPKTDTIEIDIPKGFDYTQNMIIPGKGLPLYNCNNGNLILSFILTPHRYIKVKGIHLYTGVEITLKESLIGFIKGITQLDSRLITITSESIIKPNMIKCIDDEGLLDENTNKLGNLYVKFKIIYPDSLTSEQQKFIKEWF